MVSVLLVLSCLAAQAESPQQVRAEALEVLLDIARDPSMPGEIRLEAATRVLDEIAADEVPPVSVSATAPRSRIRAVRESPMPTGPALVDLDVTSSPDRVTIVGRTSGAAKPYHHITEGADSDYPLQSVVTLKGVESAIGYYRHPVYTPLVDNVSVIQRADGVVLMSNSRATGDVDIRYSHSGDLFKVEFLRTE